MTPRPTPPWIEIALGRAGSEVTVTAWGSGVERLPSHTLGLALEELSAFKKKVGRAVRLGSPLDAPVLAQAQRIHAALLQGDVRDLVIRLGASSGGRLLVRLMIQDNELQTIPWEALCRPGTSEDFLAAGAGGVLLARGVTSAKAWTPRVVDGALRVRVLAPSSEEAALDVLRSALAEPIASGAIAWLDPIVGERAARRSLFDFLRTGPSPHVLHFLGHGGVDARSAHPTLRLADDEDGDEDWIKAEALARELESTFGDDLRLVVLESCEGAHPGLLGSAAEELARAGADAVVAHLWPVKADTARVCSASFYRALTAGERTRGDVAASLAAARRTLLLQSAEGFSPVLVLRGADSRIFDFAGKARPEPRKKAPFHVPFLRNSSFVGRDDDLAGIHALLQKGATSGARPAALTGMGGIGKTQLAVEYAYRYAEAYPGGVYWVNAAEPLQAEFARLASEIGLHDAIGADRQKQLALAFARHLDGRLPALAIFDNVEDPLALRSAEHGFIPEQLGCRLLFTTRRRDPDSSSETVDVRVLSEDIALQLLLSGGARRGMLSFGPSVESAAAKAICASLGYLPLALVLAAAFLARYPRIALGDYLTRIRKEGALAAADGAKVDRRKLGTLHEAAVGATLRTQWDALENEDARLTLTAASLLGEAALVPRARLVLLTGLADRAEPGYPAAMEDALRELGGLSLVEELTEHAIRLHPLVREFAEKQIEAREAFAAECAERLGEALWDMRRLSEEVGGRGIDAVIGDLRIANGLAGARGRARIEALIRPLDRESHALRRWDAVNEPGFFHQQLRNRCFELGIEEVRARAEAELEEQRWSWLRERIRTNRESEALVRTLEGHTELVTSMAVREDGRFAVSASWDKTLKVWDLSTGLSVYTLEGHTEDVTGVAVTANGSFAVSASWDKTLKVWDLSAGKVVRTLEGHTDRVSGVAVTADGRFAVSASWDKTLKVWDLATGEVVRTLEGHTWHVTGVAVTADGRLAVSASDDKALTVWDLSTGQAVRTLEGHTELVTGMAVTADGRLAVSASWDKTLKVWDLATGEAIRTLEWHAGHLNYVAVTADGRFAVSASDDKTLKVWDLSTGKAVRSLEGHTDVVNRVVVTGDGRFAVSASLDKTLKVWDLGTGQTVRALEGHTDKVTGVAVTVDGRFAVSASKDKTLKVWDLATGQTVRSLEGHLFSVTGVAVTADGRFAVSASWDKTLKVWDLATGEAVRSLKGHTIGVTGVAVTADGRFTISASWDNTLKVWDLRTGEAVRSLQGHTGHLNYVAVTVDGRFAVSASGDKTLKVWDLATGEAVRSLEGHTEPVTGVAVTADGRFAVSASRDKTLKVWDLGTGQAACTLEGHTEEVTGVAATVDGRFAVSTSWDNTLKVWNLGTGQPLATLEIHAPLNCCAITPDAGIILAGDSAGALHILDWRNPARDDRARRAGL